jgi:hypothetical protein
MEYLLYITKNNINGKVYAGKHIGYKTDNYIGSGPSIFLKAVKKYGKSNFTRRWLQIKISSEDQLNVLEKRLIRLLKFYWKDKCYNIHEGGSGGDLCKYMNIENRLDINKKISDSKKYQYLKGFTKNQIEGKNKRIKTLKNRYVNDLKFKHEMYKHQSIKGKKLSDRIKNVGLTQKEKDRNNKNKENGKYKVSYQIIHLNGDIENHIKSAANFLRDHQVSEEIFNMMCKYGETTIKQKKNNSKHFFTVGTKFKLIAKLN